MLSFFPRDVLDEILNLIESVSGGFPSSGTMVYEERQKLTSADMSVSLNRKPLTLQILQ